MKIKAFDRTNLKRLREDINEALVLVASQHGITLAADNARFDANNITFKLLASIVGDDGVAKTKERMALELHYPEYVDKKIILRPGGEKATVIGYNSRAQKYPFLIKTAKGTLLKVHEFSIRPV